jgi:hypothetical protein
MLLINQGTTNSLILTLTENVTIDSPFYLFEFTNDVTMVSQYIILEDISIHPERYNEFLIDERTIVRGGGGEGGAIGGVGGVGIDPIPVGAEISLSPAGQWTYRVFQEYDPHNYDPNLTEGLLEIGIAKVVPSAITTYYENNNLDNTFYVNE